MTAAQLCRLVLLMVGMAASAAAQMPDVTQMSGIPLPTGDLPAGTVSVRVVRGEVTNNVANQPVELHGGSQVWKATTDETGRAQFPNLPPGTTVHAIATVDGQRVESQEFPVPSNGGVRVMLVVAGSAAAGAAAAASGAGTPPATSTAPVAAAPGTVGLAGESRLLVDFGDDALEVFYLFDVVNTQKAAVSTAPLVFDMPSGARGVAVLEGSSPQAKAEGPRVVVSGPFTPGRTTVQIGYQLPYAGSRAAFTQTLPAALAQTTIIARKLEGVQLASPQTVNRSDMTVAGGQTYIMASGPGLAAGSVLSVELSGLPHHSAVPRYLALALAIGVIGLGVWLAATSPSAVVDDRQRLETRRERLLHDLVRLEQQHRKGRGDDGRYAARREHIVSDLEQVYAELDALGVSSSPSARADRPAAAPVTTAASVR